MNQQQHLSMDLLNSSNKSDYYIGMSIPSRASEYNPNNVMSSETILDYDDLNPPPSRPQMPSRTHSLSISTTLYTFLRILLTNPLHKQCHSVYPLCSLDLDLSE